jgi:RNA polymerase sigma factor (sigma-70 family)
VLDENRELPQEGRRAGPGSAAPGDASLEQLYLEQLPIIDKAAAHACRRYGFSHEDIEDFKQEVKLKILADDYAVIRKHQGRSKLATYLVVVVEKALLDHVDHRWGKWRPSKAAQRRGDLAVRLETLMTRDRLAFRVASQILMTEGCQASEAELSDIAARLPPRMPRRVDSLADLEGGTAGATGGSRSAAAGRRAEPAARESADERVWSEERARRREQALHALDVALAALPPEDQLIAMTTTRGGPSLAAVARQWKCEQKPLYQRRVKIIGRLRQELESAGISTEDVAEILDHADD